jgi:hypothetical protein
MCGWVGTGEYRRLTYIVTTLACIATTGGSMLFCRLIYLPSTSPFIFGDFPEFSFLFVYMLPLFLYFLLW